MTVGGKDSKSTIVSRHVSSSYLIVPKVFLIVVRTEWPLGWPVLLLERVSGSASGAERLQSDEWIEIGKNARFRWVQGKRRAKYHRADGKQAATRGRRKARRLDGDNTPTETIETR